MSKRSPHTQSVPEPRRFRTVGRLFWTILAAFSPFVADAVRACEHHSEVPRTILALYDGDRHVAPRFSALHRFAEMPLNHMGYRLLYHDVGTGLPDLPDTPLAATLSWFDAPLAEPERYAAWRNTLIDECGEHPAIIVLGHTGMTEAALDTDAGRKYLAGFGADVAAGEVAVGAFSQIISTGSPLIGFETDYHIAPGSYARLTALPGAQTQLSVQTGNEVIDLVILKPRSAYAHGSTLVRGDPRGGPLWTMDPFGLFLHALGPADWPVPDTTTTSGRRAFFATVGSEGWLMPLPARQIGDRPPLASEVLEADIITPYADLPFSVALLAGDLDTGIAGDKALRGREIAEYIIGLPNVQSATSGLTMILDWGFFAEYDQTAEAATLAAGSQARGGGLIPLAMESLGDAFANPTLSAVDITPNAPRKYAREHFDLNSETTGAIRRIAALAPEKSTPELFVWSGNAVPFPDAIAAVDASGIQNIGGGGGLAPDTSPSLAMLWPLGLDAAGGLQVYDALSGDALYTDFWTGDLSGYLALGQTLARTELPRRLKPVHLHFAARSALQFATRRAVLNNLEVARTAEIAPVRAARYASWVAGFSTTRVVAESEQRWRILDRGGLQTLRIDDAAGRALDLSQSTGVIGARRHGDALHLTLNPAEPEPIVVLGTGDAKTGMSGAEMAPALIQSRAEILAAARQTCALRLTMLAYGDAEAEWLGAAGVTYEVTLLEPDGITRRFWQELVADPDGRFELVLPLPPGQPAEVSISTPCP